MTCEECGRDFEGAACPCGWIPPKQLDVPSDEWIFTKSKLKLHRCTWRYAYTRCGFPGTRRMTGQPFYCSWHQQWERIASLDREAAEEPAFRTWWEDYSMVHGNPAEIQTFWGHDQKTVWPRLHGDLRETTIVPEPIPPVSAEIAPPDYWVKQAVMDFIHGRGTMLECLERRHPGTSITPEEQARYSWLVKKLATQ